MVERVPDSLDNAAPQLVLVVDDEPRMIRFIRMNLELEGYQVIEARNGIQALEQVRQHLPDLVVMDVMMPELDGFETLRLLRDISTVPVVLLTVKADEDDKIRGLELGADDYITKPFSPRELLSRVQAVLRRANWSAPPPRTILKIDDRLSIDFNRHQVIVEGERIDLRPTEYRLLNHLIQNAGWVVPHDTLLAKVWGYEYRDETHYLRLYINYLRKKIEPDPAKPTYILTERGVGYRFVDFKKDALAET
ncbi:MAG: response regulator transcription factor [Anaerolineales bacterium]|nr:response regulator transcription factor [Anaerolineales bacterium]MCB0010370.1 response regulator transcription factor [Anaerolineales bacterium]MCB0017088.1 response regulator transcription factor [Anaerolineales bacterium]MCB0030641.1 response regulator transcription factor [Anaerolineales bacterium]MCB8960486.1 response regulator transcription factor [Ardenticatenales bacterium]